MCKRTRLPILIASCALLSLGRAPPGARSSLRPTVVWSSTALRSWVWGLAALDETLVTVPSPDFCKDALSIWLPLRHLSECLPHLSASHSARTLPRPTFSLCEVTLCPRTLDGRHLPPAVLWAPCPHADPRCDRSHHVLQRPPSRWAPESLGSPAQPFPEPSLLLCPFSPWPLRTSSSADLGHVSASLLSPPHSDPVCPSQDPTDLSLLNITDVPLLSPPQVLEKPPPLATQLAASLSHCPVMFMEKSV